MQLEEQMLASELIFDGRVVHLYRDRVRLPNGHESEREYVRHIGAVCVVPITDEGEVLLEHQFRYPFHKVLTEIPAGKLDRADEELLAAALRELREETGAIPREIFDLGDYYGTPAIMGECIRMFLAKGLDFGAQKLDEDEFLDLYRLPLREAALRVLRGEIPDGKTQVGILRAAVMLGQMPCADEI